MKKNPFVWVVEIKLLRITFQDLLGLFEDFQGVFKGGTFLSDMLGLRKVE